jgi:hypothetical protein
MHRTTTIAGVSVVASMFLFLSTPSHASPILVTVHGTISTLITDAFNGIPIPIDVSVGDPFVARFILESTPEPGETSLGFDDANYRTILDASFFVKGQSINLPVVARPISWAHYVNIDYGGSWDDWDAFSAIPAPGGDYSLSFILRAPSGTITSSDYFIPTENSPWSTPPEGLHNQLVFGACATGDGQCDSAGGSVGSWSVHPVPDPDTGILFLTGLSAFVLLRWLPIEVGRSGRALTRPN